MHVPQPELITREAAIRMLVGLRLRNAVKRHARYFYWSLSDNPRLKNPTKRQPVRQDNAPSSDILNALTIEDCLPGRRSWPRPSRKMRNTLPLETAQRRALMHMVNRCLDNDQYQSPWKDNLLRLMADLQRRVLINEVSFNPPHLHLKEKGKDEFRCLAQYSDLSDRILQGIIAKHLRDVFDGQMRSESYAFRSDGTINHATAIQKLVEYRHRHGDQTLYVAECDIQSFFDVLNHDVVLDAYDMFVERSEETIDPWFRKAVKAYLDSYSSFRALEDSPDIQESLKDKVSFMRSSALHKDLRKMYGKVNLRDLAIGITQGGPLSPLLINLVMHRADEAVLSDGDDELFYARFCDDIIIVHPNRRKCQEALNRYLAIIQALRLPCHKMKKSLRYGKEYYDAKSKGPTAWRDCKVGTMRSSPWVDFLGEQIRFDGQRRIRQKSIEKQKIKLLEEKATLLRAVGRNCGYLKSGIDKDEVFDSFRQRLAALGVGYAPQQLMGSERDRCWAAAFPGIKSNCWTRKQMRELDRLRDRIIGSVGHGVLVTDNPESPIRKLFLGRPFSYLGFLEREDRPSKLVLMNGYEAYGEWGG